MEIDITYIYEFLRANPMFAILLAPAASALFATVTARWL